MEIARRQGGAGPRCAAERIFCACGRELWKVCKIWRAQRKTSPGSHAAGGRDSVSRNSTRCKGGNSRARQLPNAAISPFGIPFDKILRQTAHSSLTLLAHNLPQNFPVGVAVVGACPPTATFSTFSTGRNAPRQTQLPGGVGGSILGRVGGEVLFDHQRHLEDDGVVKLAQVQAGELLDLFQAVRPACCGARTGRGWSRIR